MTGRLKEALLALVAALVSLGVVSTPSAPWSTDPRAEGVPTTGAGTKAAGTSGAASLPAAPTPAPRPPADLFVAHGATGDCTRAEPCGTVQAALGRARPGQVVEVAAGSYGDVVVRAAAAEPDRPVVVRGAAGGVTRFGDLRLEAPNLVVTDVTAGSTYVAGAAHGTRLEGMQVGALWVTGADGVVVRGSTIGDVENVDAIQVKADRGRNPRDLLIEGNVIADARRTDGTSHVDCIQLLGVEGVTIRDNRIERCPGGIMIGSAAGGRVRAVVIERNQLRECSPRTDVCDGYHAVTIRRSDAAEVTLVGNTIRGGVAVSPSSSDPVDLVASGNRADSLPCGPRVSGNQIGDGGCGSGGS